MISHSTGSIADALFPQVRQRLLAALYGHPHRSFYTNELVRMAQSGIGAVQRELASLTGCRLLVLSSKGNQKHYQANLESPIFAELQAIVRKTFGIADVLRAALTPLSNGIEQAFVYGSVASGQAHGASDVDLMIVANTLSLEEVYAALTLVEASLGRRINPTLYTSAEFGKRVKARNPFLTKVLARPRLALFGSDREPT
jgi:predicted nucleotidyltransferase